MCSNFVFAYAKGQFVHDIPHIMKVQGVPKYTFCGINIALSNSDTPPSCEKKFDKEAENFPASYYYH